MRKRVAFHLYSDFEISILLPIYELIKDRFPSILTKDVGEIISFKPDILILATHHYSYFRRNLSGTIIVWTRHGFANKNSLKAAIGGADFACVSSEWVKEDYLNKGWRPRLNFWITGFVPMDKVFSGKVSLPSSLSKGFPFGRKTILYAPTWNKYFTSIHIVDGWIEEAIKTFPQVNIIIKPHPHIPRLYPGMLQKWKSINNERVILIEDSHDDIYQFFPFADILVTDASSVMFYFLALDKPIILVNNPKRFLDKEYYEPSAPEWNWRDMGEEVESISQLLSAIERAILYPDEKADRRAFYRKRVFGDLTDGKAAERIAERVKTLLDPDDADKGWVEICWNAVNAMNSCPRGWMPWRMRRFLSKKMGMHLNLFPRLKFFIKKLIRW